MAVVSMGACTVLDVRTGVSGSGNAWGRLRFLSPDYDVWECFVGGDAVASLSGLKQGSVANVTAEYRPTQYVGKDGNIQQSVRMNLVEVVPSY